MYDSVDYATAPQKTRLPTFSPVATYILIGLNIVVFLIDPNLNWLASYGVLVPGLVLYRGEWWRLLTAGFLHSTLMHIASNLYALYIMGEQVERLFGKWRFLVVYGLALLGGNLLVLAFSPLLTPTVGASGAILGIMGALLVYFYKYQDAFAGGQSSVSRLLSVILLNLAIGILPGISLWGHLGGFLAGAAASWAILPEYEPVDRLVPWLGVRIKSLDPAHWLKLAGIVIGLALLLLGVFWVRV
ncbi:MAG: rhomboid family intramembrane serine protease [Anaerolineae bacterium]|nr:rhomboid family intramembrane serine protease [Anaerolineae bacterium]